MSGGVHVGVGLSAGSFGGFCNIPVAYFPSTLTPFSSVAEVSVTVDVNCDDVPVIVEDAHVE